MNRLVALLTPAVTLAAALFSALSPTAVGGVIDPNSYNTVQTGSLSVSSGTLTFNTDTLTVSLSPFGVIGGGVLTAQPNGVDLAVFAYDNIQITGAATVQFTGRRPVALASKGAVQITPTLNVSGRTGNTLLGAYDLESNSPGSGSVTGSDLAWVGTGGGFGGVGGSFQTQFGGSAYGNLLQSIEGGGTGGFATTWDSNNSNPDVSSGGVGAGGIAIVANGSLDVGNVVANGMSVSYCCGLFGGLRPVGAGGAGGGILLSGATINYTSLQARGGSPYNGNTDATGGGGGRIALIGGFSASLASLPPSLDVSGGASSSHSLLTGIGGGSGVITVSPQTFVATDSRVLDGSLLAQAAAGQPTYEAEVRRNLTVSSGATVTLGKNQPLDKLVGPGGVSTAQVQIDSGGVFDTGSFSQRVGTLLGGGELRLAEGGRLIIDGSGGFAASITGTGTLVVSPGASFVAGNSIAA